MRTLAGDIGGTKTWLAIHDGAREVRQAQLPSADHASLLDAVRAFLGDERVDAAGFAVAGPVSGRRVAVTNLPWVVDADELERALGVRVALLNDFHGVALGLAELPETARVVLRDAPIDPSGPAVVIGAGTGLGKAVVVPGEPPRVLASEGGHVGFAPRDAFEDGLAAWLRVRHGRATWEHVVSGLGLANVYQYVVQSGHAKGALHEPDGGAIAAAYDEDDAARITIDRFVALYGAAAGDIALDVVASGGLYVAGGIAPKLHASLGARFTEPFVQAFLDKAPMRAVVERTRVTLVTDPKVGLLGAARAARGR